MQQRFTSREVVLLTGITPRQLQWWDEKDIVIPDRDGHRRLYSLDDLAEVAVICELRKRGFSLQRVRKVMRFLKKEFGKRLVETVTAAADYHLLTDGRNLYLKTSPEQVIDVLKNSRQPVLAVCLSDTVRQLQADVLGRIPEENPPGNDGGAEERSHKSSGRSKAEGSDAAPSQSRPVSRAKQVLSADERKAG